MASAMAVFAALLLLAAISAAGAGAIRNFTFSGSEGIPQATDCAVRAAAWAYGRKLQPAKGECRPPGDLLSFPWITTTRTIIYSDLLHTLCVGERWNDSAALAKVSSAGCSTRCSWRPAA